MNTKSDSCLCKRDDRHTCVVACAAERRITHRRQSRVRMQLNLRYICYRICDRVTHSGTICRFRNFKGFLQYWLKGIMISCLEELGTCYPTPSRDTKISVSQRRLNTINKSINLLRIKELRILQMLKDLIPISISYGISYTRTYPITNSLNQSRHTRHKERLLSPNIIRSILPPNQNISIFSSNPTSFINWSTYSSLCPT